MSGRRNLRAIKNRAARMRLLVKALGENGQSRFAAIAGVKSTYVRDLVSGRGSWADSKLHEIERLFGAPPGFFDSTAPIPPRTFPISNLADVRAWLGTPTLTEPADDTVPWVELNRVMAFMSGSYLPVNRLIRDATLPPEVPLVAVLASSDSPEPLQPGDLAIFSSAVEPGLRQPVLAYVAGRGVVIRLFKPRGLGRDGGTAFDLTSTDPEAEDFAIRSGADGQLIGALVQLRRNCRADIK